MRAPLRLGLAIAVLLAGAQAGRALEAGKSAAPDWVDRGSGVFPASDGGRVLLGVGAIPGIRNIALAVPAADERALAELAKGLEIYAANLNRDYASSPAGANGSASTTQTALLGFAKSLLSKKEDIVDHWVDRRDRTMYSLARINADRIRRAAEADRDLPQPLRDFITADAGKSLAVKADANAEEASPAAAAPEAAPQEAPKPKPWYEK